MSLEPTSHAPSPRSILVTVDKSHIVTIGERLYTESIELIRELVNNAYDADATRVDIHIRPDEIIIQDNGTGMDLRGLRQYFAIGSSEKKQRSRSLVYHRDRIGQFGIGKFASLTACRQFEVSTQRETFCARVVFDKEIWEKSSHSWELPLQVLSPESPGAHGTTVTLRNLIRAFDEDEVRRRLVESVPLKAGRFEVFLNDKKVTPRYYTGHRIGILEATSFGPITGEIIILPASQVFDEQYGIEVKVKQVTVCREFFGLEDSREMVTRLRGEVYADFLPVTSDRSGFVRDSAEFRSFLEVMQRVAMDVRRSFAHLSGKQERRKASRALNEALERITQALARNPDFAPFGMMPSGPAATTGAPGETASTNITGTDVSNDAEAPVTAAKKQRKKKITVKKLTPDAVVKRLRMGSSKIACCLDHFGAEGSECQTQGNVIYINRDHPLYLRSTKSSTTYIWHLARLLAQEITMMKAPSTARQAFLRQSHLLKDALGGS